MDTEEKLAEAAARKDNGNSKFKAGKYGIAIKKYKARLYCLPLYADHHCKAQGCFLTTLDLD